MASGISVKLTADVGSFKKGISEATASVKTLDAQLELNEKQLKETGDAEVYMQNKAGLLEKQLEAQKKVVSETYKALETMKKNGVSPTSVEFQKMEQNLAKASGKLTDIKTELKEVQTGSKDAKTETKGMNTELKKIGKGVAFENVTNGLKTVTEKLESAGRAAVNLGKKLTRSAMDSTEWADAVLERAMESGVDAETIQRMDNVSKFIDTDVDTIIAAKTRLAKNKDSLGELLGVESPESVEDAFWRAGEAIMAMTDEFEKEEAAQKIFGKGWKELIPLFTAGQEEYERLMAEQNVLSNEQVQKLGEADDQFKKIKQEVELLKNQFWAENSQTVIDLLQWLVDNKDGVVVAITAIGGAFAALKVGELATNIAKVVNGFKQIQQLGGGGSGGGTGGDGGTGATGGTGAAAGGKGLWASLKGIGAKIGAEWSALGGAWALTPAALVTAAVGGSVAATNAANENVLKAQQERLAKAAGMSGADADLVMRAANALGLKTDGNGNVQTGMMGLTFTNATGSSVSAILDELGQRSDEDKALLMAMINGGDYRNTQGNDTAKMLERYWSGEGFDMTEMTALLGNVVDSMIQGNVAGAGGSLADELRKATEDYYNAVYVDHDLQAQVDAKAAISELLADEKYAEDWDEISTKFKDDIEDALKEGYEGEILDTMQAATDEMAKLPQEVAAAVENAHVTVVMNGGEHANGLFSVPWDGYPAILHKGERVLTAGEAQRYTYNTYFGNVNLHNGLEVDALAESIERNNRRKRAGYGAA